jgi:hypothetical protein
LENEDTATTGAVLNPDLRSLCIGNRLHNGQPNACTGGILGQFGPAVEPFELGLFLRIRHAGATVINLPSRWICKNFYFDLAAYWGIGQGVAYRLPRAMDKRPECPFAQLCSAPVTARAQPIRTVWRRYLRTVPRLTDSSLAIE